MKRIFTLLIAIAMVVGFSAQAYATLILRGTDTLGNRLIYDDDLNITWYDYTTSLETWQNQVNWASALTVIFGGTIYDDWRLPSTVDGPWVWGYDGTTTGGYNITSNEMGHLFYTELGNLGLYATDGTNPQPGYGLTNTGYFLNLLPTIYWSGTEYSADPVPVNAWVFLFADGFQGAGLKDYNFYCALAVRSGDVSAVPEPSTLLLLGSGILGFGFFARKRMRG